MSTHCNHSHSEPEKHLQMTVSYELKDFRKVSYLINQWFGMLFHLKILLWNCLQLDDCISASLHRMDCHQNQSCVVKIIFIWLFRKWNCNSCMWQYSNFLWAIFRSYAGLISLVCAPTEFDFLSVKISLYASPTAKLVLGDTECSLLVKNVVYMEITEFIYYKIFSLCIVW